MQGSEYDFIAQQKAEEAAEAIYTAKYTNNATFAQLSNNTTGNPAGLFLVGPQPLLVPGADGLVGSVADAGGNPAYIVLPGPDGKLGTPDDIYQNLGAFTRTIAISPVAGYTNSLNQVVITVNYSTGRFTAQLHTDHLRFSVLEPPGARNEAAKRIFADRIDGFDGNRGYRRSHRHWRADAGGARHHGGFVHGEHAREFARRNAFHGSRPDAGGRRNSAGRR